MMCVLKRLQKSRYYLLHTKIMDESTAIIAESREMIYKKLRVNLFLGGFHRVHQ
jgi:hypothetical protein